MGEKNEEILRYGKMIDIVVSKYNREFYEDLKQDLYLFLLNCFENDSFRDVKNLDNYIFICLKNRAQYEYKSKYASFMETVSLDTADEVTGTSLLNSIPEKGEKEARETDDLSIEEIKEKICRICDKKDYELLYRYYVAEVSQKKQAEELEISQQAVSKRLKKIIGKLKNKLII